MYLSRTALFRMHIPVSCKALKAVVISYNRNNGNASVEGLKGEAPTTRHQMRRGVDNGEGWPHPQLTTESGERRELPQRGPRQSPDQIRIRLLYC